MKADIVADSLTFNISSAICSLKVIDSLYNKKKVENTIDLESCYISNIFYNSSFEIRTTLLY